MKKIPVKELAFMAICVAIGLVAKQIVSPVTNLLTDMINIPGGSATVGFTLAFLIIGKLMVKFPAAATAMGFVQALLAIAFGMAGNQGAFALVSYTLPGVVIDLAALAMKKRGLAYCITADILASVASALLSALLVMQVKLTGVPMLLWLLMAVLSGAAGGVIAYFVSSRVKKIMHNA